MAAEPAVAVVVQGGGVRSGGVNSSGVRGRNVRGGVVRCGVVCGSVARRRQWCPRRRHLRRRCPRRHCARRQCPQWVSVVAVSAAAVHALRFQQRLEGPNVHRRMTGKPQLELILSLSCCFSTICYRGVFDSGRVSLQQRDGAFSEVCSIPSSLQSIAICA